MLLRDIATQLQCNLLNIVISTLIILHHNYPKREIHFAPNSQFSFKSIIFTIEIEQHTKCVTLIWMIHYDVTCSTIAISFAGNWFWGNRQVLMNHEQSDTCTRTQAFFEKWSGNSAKSNDLGAGDTG